MSDSECVRVGVLSTAWIARKNIWAINNADGVSVTAVASRTIEKAKKFAEEEGLEKFYGTYEALLEDSDIDAVYIPLPTTMHLEWVTKAAKAGKHILCEKPTASSLDELKEILAACNENKVMWMDGVMFMHHKRIEMIQEKLKDNVPNFVRSNFCFCGDESFFKSNIRLNLALEPFCALGDLGWYNIRVTLMAFGWDMPSRVSAFSHRKLNDDNPITDATATLFWEDDRRAIFHCSFHFGFRQHAEISGEFGRIEINDFVLERTPEETEFTITPNPPPNTDHRSVSEDTEVVTVSGCCQEQCMWERFARVIKAGQDAADAQDNVLERWSFWQSISLKTQAVLDACAESIKQNGAVVDVASI
eukprot:m.75909 g.75909  ORF g.75909 m.75909 type:complete len:361 (-) comp11859_c1_seq1:427-1509(-)